VLLCFNFLLCNVALPFRVRILLKNPCRRFRTKCEGLKVLRGPQRICTDPRAGWKVIELLGMRSSAPVVALGDEARNEVVLVDGEMVGRRGVIDVNVLEELLGGSLLRSRWIERAKGQLQLCIPSRHN
jgi:hypothetical protein